MNDTVLTMSDVTKRYVGVKALDHVNITINRGEIYGLVGNNGAGKTTLMRVIAGQTKADTGEIALFGTKGFDQVGKERRRMGTLIEGPGFFQNLSAAKNLEYFRIQFGIPGKEVVSQVLSEVGLSDCGGKKYMNFSLGMKQRLGIALALLHKPEFLILDEPINGLDPVGIIEIRQLLLDINKKRNTTILISSHILAELSNIATKYGFISHGKMLEEITTKQLQQKCNSFLDIIVQDPKAMCVLLEKELNYFKYKVYPDHHIHLYEGIDNTEKICELAVEHHVGLSGIQKRAVNLENYYMNLVEGC